MGRGNLKEYTYIASTNGFIFASLIGGNNGFHINGVFYKVTGAVQSTTFIPIDAGKSVKFTGLAILIFIPCKNNY